jgi:hypothetical protein
MTMTFEDLDDWTTVEYDYWDYERLHKD